MADPKTEAFQIERSRLEGIRQAAGELAQAEHDAAVEAALQDHAEHRALLTDIFERSRGTPDEAEARQAYENFAVGLDLRPLDELLSQQRIRADLECREAIRAEASRLGVTSS